LKQFDTPKGNNTDLGITAQTFADLTKELDVEEQSAQESQEVEDGDNEAQPLESWIEFCDDLTKDKVGVLDASVQPVKSMLSKVC
jgi:hypothetical protein